MQKTLIFTFGKYCIAQFQIQILDLPVFSRGVVCLTVVYFFSSWIKNKALKNNSSIFYWI